MKNGALTLIIGTVLGMGAAAAQAAGDATAGASKAATCMACHGPNGAAPIMPDYPKLAGQNAAYLESALKGFRDGSRSGGNAAVMSAPASTLSDQDIADISAFFAGQ